MAASAASEPKRTELEDILAHQASRNMHKRLPPNLHDILFLHSFNITNLGPIDAFTNVRVIYLHDNNLTSVPDMSHCSLLVSLYLQRNRLHDISGLSNLKIRELDISSNNLATLSPLSTLHDLESLDLSNNAFEASELLALAKLMNLRALSFRENKLSHLPHPLTSSKLRLLDIRENPISNEDEYRRKMKSLFPDLLFLDDEPVNMKDWNLLRYTGPCPVAHNPTSMYEEEKMRDLRERQNKFYAQTCYFA